MIAAKQGGTALDAQREALHAALNAVLASSGISGEAVVPVISGVESTLYAMSGGTELPEVFTVPAHMFEVDAEAEEELQITAAQGINADSGADDDFVTIDPEQMKRIDALESGDWIELVDDNGHAEPAKLSWVSPISGRRLFVNRRGLKVCCASVDELAVMMSQGKMSIRDADSAFERAMHQVLGKLQQEGGKPAA
jgi:hypothetical protein